MGVNSLPKTVIRQRRGCDLNPRPSAPESSTLITRIPSHPTTQIWYLSAEPPWHIRTHLLLAGNDTVLNWMWRKVSVLPIIPNLLRQKLTHTATLDTTQTRLFCRVWCGGVYWVGPTAWQVRSVSGLCRSVSGGAMRPPNALGRRTHLSGRLNSHRHIRQDETVAPACRPPPRCRLHRQPRLAARPSTRSDIVRHAKRKHAVDCCVIWLNLNLFTKFHATRVIYRLTVQTLPDGWRLETAWPDTDRTVLSCLAGDVNWAQGIARLMSSVLIPLMHILDNALQATLTIDLLVHCGNACGASA